MNQMKKRKPYQQPLTCTVEGVEAVAMLNAQSGKATIGDLNDGGNLGDNTSGDATIGDLNWSSGNDLGGNASGSAKASSEFYFEPRHYSIWDDE